MKTDLYTKAVLTVIAAALSVIAFRNTSVIPEAKAATPARLLNPDGTVDVNIVKINGSSFYGSIPINVKELSGNSINSSNGIPVDIEAVDGIGVSDAVPVKNR